MSTSKKKLYLSILSLALCVVMLIGTTLAWFSESISSGDSKIVAGTLDMEVYWTEDYEGGDWHNVEESSSGTVFGGDSWEPGYVQVRYIKVVNAGDLAFKFKLGVKAAGEVGKLAEAIDVYCMDNITANINGREAFKDYPNRGTLSAVLKNESNVEATGIIASTNAFGASVDEKVVAVALKMREDAGNEYQGKSIGDGFYITASATQVEFESDAFDNTYDSFPALTIPDSITVLAQKNSSNRTVSETVLENGSDIKAVVPAGVLMKNGVSALTLTVTKVSENGNISESDTSMTRVLDVHVEGVAADNDVPIIVTIKNAVPRNMNIGAIELAHKEGGSQNPMAYKADVDSLSAHNDYTFDSEGTVSLALCTFSNITFEVDGANPWDGTADTSWYSAGSSSFTLTNIEDLAGLAVLVNEGNDFNGKTVTLGGENNTWYINRESDSTYNEFTPIGKGSGLSSETGSEAFRPFRGTFDGNDHIISGFYHNYTASPIESNNIEGIFGSVENATIKNLTVANSYIVSYGSSIGLVADYVAGNCTFENITLKDNYVSAYNNYLGGIIGCAYDYSSVNANVAFKNINIDSTNSFNALWSTYDLPCGGIAGGVYPATTVSFENCNVSCEMNLYNDCCGNYQWFAYRYSGMLIGYIRGNSSQVKSFVNNNITCTGVTVKYGEWTDLYYCELISLGKGSYNDAHQWKYKRINKSQVVRDASGNITGCTAHNHAANNSAAGRCAEDEDNIAVNIPFNQLFGGGQGVYGITEKSGVTVVANTGSFELAFPNTDSFLYRAGNMNAIALGSLFKAKGGTDIRSNAITLIAKQLQGNVKAVYTPNTTNWAQGTIKFTGTGVTQLLLSYYDNTVLSLNLEVINAMNATSATSATANDVVLLNDAAFSGLSVSNGHTFHGNGFTITCTSDSSCGAFHSSCGYVSLTNGTIDNTRVICPIFENQYIYQSQVEKVSDRYVESRCAIEGVGNSTIANCYVYGGRAAVFTGDSCNTLTIENTTLAGGTVCNIDFYAGQKAILRNVTTSMNPQTCTFNSSKQVYGLGIIVENAAINIDIEGTFRQYNWITKDEASEYIDDTLSSFVTKAFSYDEFVHTYGGKEYANTGIIYLDNWDSTNLKTNMAAGLTDNRTNKEGYTGKDINISVLGTTVNGGVYSVGSSGALNDSTYYAPAYASTGYNVVSPIFSFDNSANAVTKTSETEPYCTYSNGLISVGTKDSSKTLDFSSASIVKDGETLSTTVSVNNSKATVNGRSITFDTSVTNYTVTFATTINSAGYNADGSKKSGSTTFSWNINVHFAVLAYDPPEWNDVSTTGSNHVWATKNPNSTDPDFSEAIPIYNGIKVKYYDKSGALQTKDFSDVTTIPTINSNSTGSSVTFDDGSILTLSCTQSGYSYQLCAGKVYIYKTTVRNNRDTTSYSITYSFTDPNGLSTSSKVTVKYSLSESDPSTCIKLDDFLNGTYTTTVPGCVVKGTLVTMADGSKKPVEDVKAGDMLLVWDLNKGAYSASPVVFNDAEKEQLFKVVNLYFSDGTKIGVVSEHGFFDATLGKYVYLDLNAADYIGHSFVKANGNSWTTVKLTNVVIKDEVTSVYSPVTYSTLCLYTNDMLSMPGGISGLFNIYDVDVRTMKYDEQAKKADKAKYGLFTLDDFGGMIPAEAFEAFNGADLKVAIAKGILSWSDIEQYANRYIPLM